MTGVFLCSRCASTVYQPADGGGCPCCGYCSAQATNDPEIVTLGELMELRAHEEREEKRRAGRHEERERTDLCGGAPANEEPS